VTGKPRGGFWLAEERGDALVEHGSLAQMGTTEAVFSQRENDRHVSICNDSLRKVGVQLPGSAAIASSRPD
jgi:hypothetical protein